MTVSKSIKADVDYAANKSTKDQIRQISLKLFAENGYENVTIRKICQAAKISIGTFYNNYGNKQDILLEIYNQIDDALKRVPSNLLLPFKEEVLVYLRTKVEAVVKFHETYGFPPVFIALQQSESSSLWLEDRDIYYHVFNAALKGQYKGEVRKDLEAQAIARKLLRCLLGLIFDWCMHNCEYDIMKMVDEDFDLLLDVFAAKPGT